MERERNKQVEAAEEAQAAWLKARHDQASHMTVAERDKAERLKLYHTLKAHGAIDVYYHLYPDERPRGQETGLEAVRQNAGRER